MRILDTISSILHRDCEGNIHFFEAKVEAMRRENTRLNERVAQLVQELALSRLELERGRGSVENAQKFLNLTRADAEAFEAWAIDESDKRHQLVARFTQLARSRNRYRRKYVVLHRLTKAYRDLAEAIEAMMVRPDLTTAKEVTKLLRPFCHHHHTHTEVNGTRQCRACHAEVT